MTSRKLPLSEKRWEEPALRGLLAGQLAGMLGARHMEVDPAKSFDEYGLDSIDAVIATEHIGEQLGIELPPEFMLYHRSVNALVGALLNHQCADLSASTAPQAKEGLIFLFPGGGGLDE